MADASIDITGDVCPITFVKVKLKLEKMAVGAQLSIRMNGGEPVENLPRSLQEEGHRIVSLTEDADAFVLTVEKRPK